MRLFLFAVICVTSQNVHADMYKCKGANGTAYQEQPCKGGQKIEIAETPVDGFQSRIENAISLRKVMVGMNREQVVRAWGKPSKVNRTLTGGGSHEQWVYDNGDFSLRQYVYLENGVVRSLQTPSAD